ncbi:MAG TPA: MauE/DoxX family redox-associated membrane protein [Steroidobacteraceae bacterium]
MMHTMMLDPAIGLLLSAASALLFASASAHKLRDLKRFDEIFRAYGLLTVVARVGLSWSVPVIELAVAGGMLFDASRPYAATGGIMLLLAYAAAITVNLKRGRRDLACGCGGPDERRPIAPWMVWRNILVASCLAATFTPWTTRLLTPTDAVTVVFGLLTLALIYLCADQLMGYPQRSAQFGRLR